MTHAPKSHAERDLIAFLDRVAGRYRMGAAKGRPALERERYIPKPAETRQQRYDRETERLRAALTERKESAHVAR